MAPCSVFKYKSPKSMKTLLALLSLTLVSITICNAQDDRYSFKESYELGTQAKVSVSSSDGNIEAVAFEGKKTDIFYIVKKNNKLLNISRQELEKEVTLEVVQAGNSLSIVVKYKNELQSFNWKDQMVVSFRLQVPKETACDLRTSDGNVSIKGLTSDQKCKTSDGNLNISDIEGSVFASTSDGNISVKKVVGPVEVKTSDGNIQLEDIKGDAKAGTSDGNIGVHRISGNTSVKTSDGDILFRDLSGSVTANTSDGNVSGNVLELKSELTVRTSDGNISVAIPDRLGLDLDIKGESLDVPLNNFSGRSDKKSIQGKSNGGGIPVNLSTSGHVTLSYR
jgi:DUF4097 and DUF4098 domain-containing protein YvlB